MITYTVVKIDAGFDEAKFNQFKQSGIVENSFATMRKNLASTKGIVKWTGQVPADMASYVDWTGNLAEMHAYLATNSALWQVEQPQP